MTHPRTINGVVYTTSLLSEALKAAGYRCERNHVLQYYLVIAPNGRLVADEDQVARSMSSSVAWNLAATIEQRNALLVLVDDRDPDVAQVALDALDTGRVSTWSDAVALATGGAP